MTNNAGGGGILEIPIEYRSQFSDSQAEELISQFQQSDSDGSGSIDEQEFRALLARMSLSVTDAEAGELVESIDTNGNGLIDFQELVVMVVQIKKGDDRFRALKKFVEALDTTSIAVSEREAVWASDRVSAHRQAEGHVVDTSSVRDGARDLGQMVWRERQHYGGWKRYYGPATSHTFYFDEFSGDCVHDTFATPASLAGIRKPRPKSRFALTKEELQRRKEEEEWTSALQRARRREEHAKESELQAGQSAQQAEERSEELQKAIQKLEMSITSEHLNINGKGLAYVDARYRRELEIFLKAQQDGLLTSADPARESPRDEIERSNKLERELDDEERESAAIEDVDTNRASRERRRVSRLLGRTVERMKVDLELCRWGYERWFPRVMSLETHERDERHRRRMVCRLGCALVLEHQRWRQVIYDHEAEKDTKCDSRIFYCPRDCGVWIPHLQLEHHMRELCMKRPVGDLLCRLGCGKVYQGGAHEQDDCELRKVECTWPKCRAIILAKERNAHRRNHLISSGVMSFLTAEVHEYKVPKDMKLLKIQVWGAGGGGGGTCRHGDGGSACKQRKLKDGDDFRIGRPGGDLTGGEAGECDEHNPICRFVGTDGTSMQGGNGAEFGGGGGGGLFGGGGFALGIVGGGSSFVNKELFDRKSIRVEPGAAVLPGGMDQNPPQSVRGAYWDVVDGVVGEGGTSTFTALEKGKHGGVRLARPGFFNDMKFHR